MINYWQCFQSSDINTWCILLSVPITSVESSIVWCLWLSPLITWVHIKFVDRLKQALGHFVNAGNCWCWVRMDSTFTSLQAQCQATLHVMAFHLQEWVWVLSSLGSPFAYSCIPPLWICSLCLCLFFFFFLFSRLHLECWATLCVVAFHSEELFFNPWGPPWPDSLLSLLILGTACSVLQAECQATLHVVAFHSAGVSSMFPRVHPQGYPSSSPHFDFGLLTVAVISPGLEEWINSPLLK